MSNLISLSASVLTGCAQAFINLLDSGSTPATLKFYTLPYPATRGAAITTQIHLFTCVCGTPAGAATNGMFVANAITDDEAVANSGDAAWVRVENGDGAWVGDYAVSRQSVESPPGSGQFIAGPGPFTMLDTQVWQGGTGRVTSWVHRFAPGNAAPLS